MKFFIKLHLIFISCLHIYAQESAIKLEAAYTGDLVNNLKGGIHNGTNYLGLANLMISFNTEEAGLWSGGSFFLNAANTHGGEPSADLIGDFQVASNIEAGNLSYLHELWFRQQLENITIKAGLQDLSAEFAVSEFGSLFLNSSFGVHSTIADNIPSPIFPLTALGVLFNYNISNQFNFKIAGFDGLPDDFNSNPHNLKWNLNSSDGMLTVSEVSFSSSIEDLTGTYKLGSYYHNHISAMEDSELQEYTNNYGFYFVGDQVIYQNPGGTQLGIFTQAALSPERINDNNYYLGAGINFKGLFTDRKDDILGVAFAQAGFSHKKDETVIELSYSLQITENISLQPDVQYIMNPSGTDKHLNNPLVGIIRLGINF